MEVDHPSRTLLGVAFGSLLVAAGLIGIRGDITTPPLLLLAGLAMGEVVERSARFKHRRRDDRRQVQRLHRVGGLFASGEWDQRNAPHS